MRNSIKIIGILMAALSMLLTATVVSTPDAEAHAVGGSFTHAQSMFGTTCPSGSTPSGPIIEQFGRPVISCAPDGYTPVGTDAELCSEAPGARQVEGVCSYDRAVSCGTRGGFTYPVASGLCVRPTLILISELDAHLAEKAAEAAKNNPLILGTQICIEDERVQENAQGLKVGNRFLSDGVSYEIVTGGSYCSFNCENGYDVNCDGKLGDFCPAEYDLSKVTDVGLCLSETTAAS